MRRFVRWCGANPLHLLAFVASFALAGYASVRFLSERPVAAAAWFVGAAVGHDLVLLPLYSLADRPLSQLWRRRAEPTDSPPAAAWINYLRFPLALSGLLLLVWFPTIFRLSHILTLTTRLSSRDYLAHWLGFTGVVFLISAVAFAVRLGREKRWRADPVTRGDWSAESPGTSS